MGKLCGPVIGIVALFSAATFAAEPSENTASSAPVVGGESAIQPVSLNIAARPLKVDGAKADPSPKTGKESRSALKTESGKTVQKDESRKKTDEKPKPQKPLTRKPLKRRVVIVKATWCGACQSLNSEWPRLRKVRWRIGNADTDHFQLIDTDQDPGVVGRFGVTQLPTLLLIENGKVIDRAGVLNAKDLAEFYYGRL